MKTRLMIKKTMTITSLAILVAAISVATTMTFVQADPTGDIVVITVPQATQVGPTLPVDDTVEYEGEINGDASFPISVDIDNGFVSVLVPSGDPNGLIDVHIEDIDWTGLGPTEDGAIIALSCEIEIDGALGVPLPSAVFTRDSIWITVDTSGFLVTEFDVHCTFDAVHGDLKKSIVDCEPIPIKEEGATECTFNISYNGPRATIIDTISAAWKENPIGFDPDECIVDVDPVTNEKGKNKKGNNKSATGITCDDVGESADIDITVETRQSPSGKNKWKPTECGDFEINGGAKAILLDDDTGEPVLGTLDGLPIVIVQTDPLFVEAIENTPLSFECEQ